jgi:16S rRNA (uracil1498-N3)-methyltransferase
MSERFFVAEPITGDSARLTDEEARHLAAVMRAKAGDPVTLFDGSGAEFTAEVTAIRKQAVELAILKRENISRELPFELTLAVALPKGDRQKWLVEKATELGVTRLVPLVTERGVAQPVESALERLRRTVIEASKQCGRNRLMDIASPQQFKLYVCQPANGATRWIGDASGKAIQSVQPLGTISRIIAIGPEGGFTPAEHEAASATGWQAISLGRRILRVETAALGFAVIAANQG